MKKLKIINKGKFIRSSIILLLSIISILFIIINSNKIEEKEITYATYHVSKGDTLWTIAKEQNSNKDIREIIYMIRQDNNIGANLSIGQEIQIRNIY